jgi:hypothetical protein
VEANSGEVDVEFEKLLKRGRVLDALDGQPHPGDCDLVSLLRWSVIYGEESTIDLLCNLMDSRDLGE